jgi:hypothetical protein
MQWYQARATSGSDTIVAERCPSRSSSDSSPADVVASDHPAPVPRLSIALTPGAVRNTSSKTASSASTDPSVGSSAA